MSKLFYIIAIVFLSASSVVADNKDVLLSIDIEIVDSSPSADIPHLNKNIFLLRNNGFLSVNVLNIKRCWILTKEDLDQFSRLLQDVMNDLNSYCTSQDNYVGQLHMQNYATITYRYSDVTKCLLGTDEDRERITIISQNTPLRSLFDLCDTLMMRYRFNQNFRILNIINDEYNIFTKYGKNTGIFCPEETFKDLLNNSPDASQTVKELYNELQWSVDNNFKLE